MSARTCRSRPSTHVVFTRDHDVIRDWAEKRQAVPGDRRGHRERSGHRRRQGRRRRRALQLPGHRHATVRSSGRSGSGTSTRTSARSSTTTTPRRRSSSRYRIVKAAEWKDLLPDSRPRQLYSDLLQAALSRAALEEVQHAVAHQRVDWHRGGWRSAGPAARADQSVRRHLEHHSGGAGHRRLLARGQGRGWQAHGHVPEPRRQPGCRRGRQS